MLCKKKISVHMEIALDSVCKIGYNRDTFFMQESPSGMASASQADSGGSLRSTPSTAQRAEALPFPVETGSNNSIKCRNRLAVWRQLPKLILAGSTPVSCSSTAQPPGCVFLQETAFQADLGGSLRSTPSTAQRAEALPFPAPAPRSRQAAFFCYGAHMCAAACRCTIILRLRSCA